MANHGLMRVLFMFLGLLAAGACALGGCGGTVLGPDPAPNPNPTPTPSASSSAAPPAAIGDEPPAGKGCTALGCTNGLTLSIVPPQRWAAGAYRFVIDADGQVETCTGSLPLPPCSQGSALTCTGPAIAQIGESGCALGASEQGFSSINFTTGPTRVNVEVERDGHVIGGGKLMPTYATVHPNGPACGPACRQGMGMISVSAK